MSSRLSYVLWSDEIRQRVAQIVMTAEKDTRVDIKGPKRTLDQNSRMWAMLTDIAEQKVHCGRKYTTDQWKCLMLHGCGREIQFIPSLDNSTFIPWGQSSSDLSKAEMAELIEFMLAWGAQNGVVFHDRGEPERQEWSSETC